MGCLHIVCYLLGHQLGYEAFCLLRVGWCNYSLFLCFSIKLWGYQWCSSTAWLNHNGCPSPPQKSFYLFYSIDSINIDPICCDSSGCFPCHLCCWMYCYWEYFSIGLALAFCIGCLYLSCSHLLWMLRFCFQPFGRLRHIHYPLYYFLLLLYSNRWFWFIITNLLIILQFLFVYIITFITHHMDFFDSDLIS